MKRQSRTLAFLTIGLITIGVLMTFNVLNFLPNYCIGTMNSTCTGYNLNLNLGVGILLIIVGALAWLRGR